MYDALDLDQLLDDPKCSRSGCARKKKKKEKSAVACYEVSGTAVV